MSPEKLADEIERIILLTASNYSDEITSFQEELYNRLVSVLKDLEVDSEGYIKQSSHNRSILSKADEVLSELLPGESFTEAVSRTLEAIPLINEANSNYFSSISEGFTENRNFIKSLQKQTAESIERTLLEDGLTAQIRGPLTDILNRNINTGGKFSGFLEEIQSFIKGNDQVEGRILSYSRTHLSDTLFNYSRAYQESVTSDLKLDWYLFAGGLIDKSREFCRERSGRYFHRKEIIGWVDLDWQGRRQGTTESSIFIFLGGYSCRHSVIPVHKSIVPKEDLDRVS